MSEGRFGKLERARAPSEPRAATPEPGRFEEPQAGEPSGEPHRSPSPEAPTTLSDEAFQRLPTLLCGACQVENTKFSSTCQACGHPLDSAESVALNLARLAPLEEALQAEHARVVARAPAVGPARTAQTAQTAGDAVGPWPPPTWAKWLVAVNVALALHLFAPTGVAWLGTVAAAAAAFAWARQDE